MRRSRRSTSLLFALATLVVAGVTRLTAPPAARADEDLVEVPNVAGKPVEEAKAALSAAGFLAATYEIDGVPVGSVAAQMPVGGLLRPRGLVVTLDVRVHLEGAAPAPQAVGLTTAAASAAFGAQYDLVFQPVPGAAADKGKVVAQAPAMGADLPPRGRFTLSFVPDDALPGTVPVPAISGFSPADAINAIAGAGLHARVTHIAMPGSPPDMVVGQNPLPGTEAARYSSVDVVVTAPGGGEAGAPTGPVVVPNVVGMSESSARAALDGAGLDTTVEWIDGDASRAFLVQSQDPAAGAEAAADTAVRLQIVRFGPAPGPTPPAPETKVAMPDLVGQTLAQAQDLLSSIGLIANPILEPNGSVPALEVFAQQFVPGTMVDVGTPVAFRVAQPPPPPAPVPVPDFYGRTKGDALALAAGAGLALSVIEIVTASHPPHRVYSQSVPAYASVPLGSALSVKLARPAAGPALVPVPDLVGKSRPQALALLASVGLSGFGTDVTTGSHPLFKVYSQFPTAPIPLPVGATVWFKVAVPPASWKTVPDVIGMWKLPAAAAVSAAGLTPDVIEVYAPGKPVGRVFQQDPVPGQIRPPGSTVHLKVSKALTVVVPNVVTKTTAAAAAILSAAGLTPDVKLVVAPPHPPGIVYDQAPNGGVSVTPGSVVKIWVPLGPGPTVVVPNVLGKTQAQAMAILGGVGLAGNPVLVPTNAHPAGKVFLQLPVSGATVASGASIQIRIAQPVGPAVVVVPNLFGLFEGQAAAALAAKGLNPNFQHVATFLHPVNRVFDQNPNALTLASSGSVVTVKIAVTPAVATVPNVVGLTPLQAKLAIEAAGYVSSGANVPMIFKPHGRAYWQSPAAGTHPPVGSIVSWRWNP